MLLHGNAGLLLSQEHWGVYSQRPLSPLGAVRHRGQWAEGAQVTFQESGSGEGGGKVEGGLALRDTAFSWYAHRAEERLQADKNTAVAEQSGTKDGLMGISNGCSNSSSEQFKDVQVKVLKKKRSAVKRRILNIRKLINSFSLISRTLYCIFQSKGGGFS